MVEIGVIYSVLRKKPKKIQEEALPEPHADDDAEAAAAAAAAVAAAVAAKAEAAAADAAAATTAASERINEKVVNHWTSSLRGPLLKAALFGAILGILTYKWDG